jgi:hypothetical protein
MFGRSRGQIFHTENCVTAHGCGQRRDVGQTVENALSGSLSLEGDLCRRARLFGELFAKTELFFGSAKPDGSMVTLEEFRLFLGQEVTPRFPDGLTLLVGLGHFREASGATVQERSMLLILLYPFRQSGSSDNIEQIREAYKIAFQQQSVLRVDSRACVSF